MRGVWDAWVAWLPRLYKIYLSSHIFELRFTKVWNMYLIHTQTHTFPRVHFLITGCLSSPFHYMLYTNECIKCSEDTVIFILLHRDDCPAVYLDEIHTFKDWCVSHHLFLTSKRQRRWFSTSGMYHITVVAWGGRGGPPSKSWSPQVFILKCPWARYISPDSGDDSEWMVWDECVCVWMDECDI